MTLAAPFAALALAELGLRAAGFEGGDVVVPMVVWSPLKDLEFEHRNGLHRLDDGCLWTPRPGAQVDPIRPERINPEGFRGPSLPAEREPGTLLVALLGESALFGSGVPWEESCAPRLETALAAHGLRVRVLNAAVVGHTVLQGLGRWRADVRPLRPDAVVIHFGATNEHAPCQGYSDAEKLDLARERRAGLDASPFGSLRLVRLLHERRAAARTREHEELMRRSREARELPIERIGSLDWEGCRRVPPEVFETSLAELVAEVRAAGALPLLCDPPRTLDNDVHRPILLRYSQAIARVSAAAPAPLADVRGRIARAMATAVPEAPIFLPDDDWHLAAAGHAIVAETLAEALAAELAAPPVAR